MIATFLNKCSEMYFKPNFLIHMCIVVEVIENRTQ